MANKNTPSEGRNAVGFLGEVQQELRQVTWPTKKEVTHLTVMVIGVSAGVGIFLGILDYIYTQLIGI